MRAGWAAITSALGVLASPAVAEYSLKDDYGASNFFDMFNFFTEADPTHGYVQYVSQSVAQSAGLINSSGSSIYMGVDSVNVASGSGRESVRLTSKASYTHGMIILDLAHMPGGICGTWPAFWTVGPSWPSAGEIDIIEGVNSQAGNDMTLHTSAGCSISSFTTSTGSSASEGGSSSSSFSGSVITTNCDSNAAGQPTNAGCQISDASVSNSYGAGFNAVGGGVYATEWTSDFIRIFFFPRGSIPSDISSANPNPNQWGTPAAYFSNSGCDIDSHFQNHQIVFDTTFCGDWAGQVWSSDATCSSKASTCQSYVQNNPGAFQDAYWSVNSLKVYTNDGASSNPTSSSSISAASTVYTSATTSTLGSSASGWPLGTSSIPLSSSTSGGWARHATSVPPTVTGEATATSFALAGEKRDVVQEEERRKIHRHMARHAESKRRERLH